MKKGLWILLFSSFLIVTLVPLCWGADKYPSHSISLVSAAPPGGYADLINRSLARALEKQLGVVVVPENKPGGGDIVAASYIANAPADGHVLGFLADGPLVYAHLLGRATYSRDDIRVIGQLICTTLAMYVRADSPWKNFQQFMEYAQKNPGLTYGHVGMGSATWARMEYINKVGNLKMRGVPFSGDQDVIPALLGKHIDVGSGSYQAARHQADAGKIRLLFSFTPPGQGPDPSLATIPSAFGKDVPDIAPPSIHLTAPGKTPEPIIKVLEAALEKASKDPDFNNDLKKLYANVCYLDGKTTKIKHEEKMLQLKPIMQRAGLIK